MSASRTALNPETAKTEFLAPFFAKRPPQQDNGQRTLDTNSASKRSYYKLSTFSYRPNDLPADCT